MQSLWTVVLWTSVLIIGVAQDLPDRFQVEDMSWMNLHKATSLFLESQCAGSTIIHHGFGKCQGNLGIYIVPHRAIFHDGVQCGTDNSGGEYILIVPSERIINAQTAAFNNLLTFYAVLAANERAINAFRVLNDVDPISVGFELTSDRVCGNHTVPQNTVYFFIKPGSNDINFGFAYLGRAEIGMVFIRPDEQLCMYKESRRLGPSQPAFETPTPSPSFTDLTLPHAIFDFANPENIPTCFPAHGIDVTRPSVIPSPTPSVIQTALFSPSHASVPSGNKSASAETTVSGMISGTAPYTVSQFPSAVASFSALTGSYSPNASAISGFSSSSVPGATSIVPSVSESEAISPSVSLQMTGTKSRTVQPSKSRLTRPSSGATSTSSVGTSTEVLSTSPSPINTTTEPVCFPTRATVRLSTGVTVSMRELQVGDLVLVQGGSYSPVFMFSHRDFFTLSNFIAIRTSSGKTMTLSGSHYVPSGELYKTAMAIQVGDFVTLGNGSVDVVVKKWKVKELGLHNPHTLDGTIVVNGVLASTFTAAVAPKSATCLLAPARGLFRVGGPSWLLEHLTHIQQSQVLRTLYNLLPRGNAYW